MSNPKPRKKAAEAPQSTEPAQDATDTAPEPETAPQGSSDPLVLASSSERFSIADLAAATGVPAREIRNALAPVIGDGTLTRLGPDLWQWSE